MKHISQHRPVLNIDVDKRLRTNCCLRTCQTLSLAYFATCKFSADSERTGDLLHTFDPALLLMAFLKGQRTGVDSVG